MPDKGEISIDDTQRLVALNDALFHAKYFGVPETDPPVMPLHRLISLSANQKVNDLLDKIQRVARQSGAPSAYRFTEWPFAVEEYNKGEIVSAIEARLTAVDRWHWLEEDEKRRLVRLMIEPLRYREETVEYIVGRCEDFYRERGER